MRLAVFTLATLASIFSVPAQAGVYTDDLGKCIVDKTSPTDRTALVQWLFGVLAASPDVAALSKVTSADRARMNVTTAQMFERLVVTDCRDRTVKAVKYDGAGAIQEAFGLLGKVAMADMTTQPQIAAEFERLNSALDLEKVKAVMTEAGVPTKPAPAPKK